MSDLIDRQAAIEAAELSAAEWDGMYVQDINGRIREALEKLPSAQQERIIYGNMSDEEFEKWLYGHGICSPNIREPIPCAVVPLLIDNAISELPSAQPDDRLAKIAALVEGTIDHFDLNDAMDLLYQIKEVLK